MKIGRPTKYKTEYNDMVVSMMMEGMSIIEICFELQVSKQTFYDWCEKYPDFLDSKKKGVDFSEGWWMKKGRTNLENGVFNSTLWYMNMKNRFKWADKQEIKQETNITGNIDVSKLPTEVLEALEKAKNG